MNQHLIKKVKGEEELRRKKKKAQKTTKKMNRRRKDITFNIFQINKS
jgi:hypothetical protein